MNIDFEFVKEMAKKIGMDKPINRSGRCLVIGGNPSIKGVTLRDYVDGFEGDVIRVNSLPSWEHVINCGSRTDILFTNEWVEKNADRFDLVKKIVLRTDDVDSISKNCGMERFMYLTTGMICLLVALSTYDRVEILGFGKIGSDEKNDRFVSLHDGSRGMQKSGTCPHDLEHEHKTIHDLMSGQFKGRLTSLENDNDIGLVRQGCWDRFDKKTMICYTGNRTSRMARLYPELTRVGLHDVEMQWQFPNPFNGIMLQGVNHKRSMYRGGFLNCTMGHYRAIKTAYHLGRPNVLIMEDDIRFLNDIDKVKSVVESLPDDYDIALFECSYRTGRGYNDLKDYLKWRDCCKVNEDWSTFYRMYSMACYAMSRKGMEKMIWCYESACDRKSGWKLRPCDHYLSREFLGNDLKLYFNRKNICIQKPIGAASSDMKDMSDRYRNMGIDTSLYAEA